MKQTCAICKVVGILAIIGALNWGSIALFQVNFVENLLGQYPGALRIVYGLVGLSGLALLLSFFKACPACCKKP